MQQSIEIFHQKSAVFEGAEQTEVDEKRGTERSTCDPPASKPSDQPPMHIVEHCRSQQKQYPDWFPPRIEKERKADHHRIAVSDLFRKKIKQQIERQEQINKQQIGKNHGQTP